MVGILPSQNISVIFASFGPYFLTRAYTQKERVYDSQTYNEPVLCRDPRGKIWCPLYCFTVQAHGNNLLVLCLPAARLIKGCHLKQRQLTTGLTYLTFYETFILLAQSISHFWVLFKGSPSPLDSYNY